MLSKIGRWSVLALSALLIVSTAFAQIRSSTITGTVQDATGAVLPGVEVALTNQDTNISNTTTTTETGQYTFPYLQAGTYTVAINKTGFSPYSQKDIEVTTAQTVRIDVTLEVGAVQQAIEVTASSAHIQTESSTVSGR